jgi:hypothetical protein
MSEAKKILTPWPAKFGLCRECMEQNTYEGELPGELICYCDHLTTGAINTVWEGRRCCIFYAGVTREEFAQLVGMMGKAHLPFGTS